MFHKLISKIKIRKTMPEKQALKIFYNFATGIIPTKVFWEMYCTDESLRNALIYDKKRRIGLSKFDANEGKFIYLKVPFDSIYEYNPDNLLQKVDITRLEDRYQIFVIINRYLISRKIDIGLNECNEDAKEYLMLMGLLPSWVECTDIEILRKVYADAPVNYNKSQKKSWCKEKIKELFKYDNKKPKWVQQAEWPVKHGVPLVFSHQETTEEGFEKYFFYNPENKEVTIVEQYE